MNKEQIVNPIVDTYELRQRAKDKVRWIANYRVEELPMSRYSSIYGYIASLVDKFQIPYEERFFMRLDSSIKNNSKTLYYDRIEDERFSPENEIFKEENFEGMSLEDIIDVLNPCIDPSLLDLIKQLGNGNDNTCKFNTSPEYLITNAHKIQEMLESLFNEYGENLSLIITRPIKHVQFFPSLKIKFGYRRYNGNPLAFFIEHRKSYPENLFRKQLEKLDGALSKALWKYNQMSEAIPFIAGHGEIPSEKISYILSSYEDCNVARKVAKKAGVATATVTKYWRGEGFEIQKRGSVIKKSEEERKIIIKAYSERGNATSVAKEFNISRKTLIGYINKSMI